MHGLLNRGWFQAAVVIAGMIGAGMAWAVEKPTTPQTTCVTQECHSGYKGKPYVHGPVSLGECKSCHEAVNPIAHTFALPRKGRDLCEYCHPDRTTGKVVHEPLRKGDCTQCHDPHASSGKALIREKTVASLCAECHRTTQGMQFLHGPTAVGECSICHPVHSSDHAGLLTLDRADLCASCHVSTQEELKAFAFVHEPARGDCEGCHDPHGANTSKMLKADAPNLCYACHADIKKIAETSVHQHRVAREDGGCLKCHTPHASTVRFLMSSDPATLCLSCHDRLVAVSREDVLGAFTAEIKDKKFLHGPVRDKSCSGCHIAHGSEHFRLLAMEYPPLFYAPYSKANYALCFGCHSETVVQMESTADLTDFRNGTTNLHYVHVNKTSRGRTCRACHQTHASNLPSHIRESVPYGMWNLPIGFAQTETGGTCSSGCHVPRGYNRVTPLDYAVRQAAPQGGAVPETSTPSNAPE